MKLEKILDNLNSLEKNAFLKIIDGIIVTKPKNAKEIEKILSDPNQELKSLDNTIISKIFRLGPNMSLLMKMNDHQTIYH